MLSDEVTANNGNIGSTMETTNAIKRVAREATRSLGDIVWAVDPASGRPFQFGRSHPFA